MALVSPGNVGHRLGSAAAPVVLEAYLDYVCPFSKRFYTRFVQEVFPYVEQQYPGQVQFIFRHQVQPWHPQSSMVHEAALAVEQVSPDAFFPFSNQVFENQEE
ncbi:hypothetical protein H4R34_002602 [Dimargaris verticillata]|uniref:Thioredoxin-like fold domain-containing protein n=1 Tax=Dimargaris verticillata TaxID=2761393 RepID=A0A9W8B7Q5_9FUNG|nr:hypothetical protein H4R34_002602 [Dimargaris verticillata]